jgi:hypothetical protein
MKKFAYRYLGTGETVRADDEWYTRFCHTIIWEPVPYWLFHTKSVRTQHSRLFRRRITNIYEYFI